MCNPVELHRCFYASIVSWLHLWSLSLKFHTHLNLSSTHLHCTVFAQIQLTQQLYNKDSLIYYQKCVNNTVGGVGNNLPSLSWIVTVATLGDTVTRFSSLAWSAGSRIKLVLNISVSSGILSFTTDTLKES